LIETDDVLYPTHPMSITVQKIFPNPLKDPTTLSCQSTFSFLGPVFKAKT